MTAPFVSVAAAILYFGWLWHDRSAVDGRREDRSKSQPKKEKNRNPELLLARPAAVQTPRPRPLNLKNRDTTLREEIAQ